jgi:hypothetical protein
MFKRFLIAIALVAATVCSAKADTQIINIINRRNLAAASSGGTIGQTTGKTVFEGGANNVLWISSYPATTSGTVGFIHTYIQFGDSPELYSGIWMRAGQFLLTAISL